MESHPEREGQEEKREEILKSPSLGLSSHHHGRKEYSLENGQCISVYMVVAINSVDQSHFIFCLCLSNVMAEQPHGLQGPTCPFAAVHNHARTVIGILIVRKWPHTSVK